MCRVMQELHTSDAEDILLNFMDLALSGSWWTVSKRMTIDAAESEISSLLLRAFSFLVKTW